MRVRENPGAEPGSGLMRALSKIKTPSGRRLSKPAEAVRHDVPAPEQKRRQSARELAEAQDKLKSRREVRHDGLELWPLPGLAPMTRVRTSFGDVHAVALRKGDPVLLKSGDYRPIVWINRIMLDEHVLKLKPDSNPISIAPGALGHGRPANEVTVSPRQIISADEKSGLMKPREASMLVSKPGVRRLVETGLAYTMFHVGECADIYCEGLYLRFPIET